MRWFWMFVFRIRLSWLMFRQALFITRFKRDLMEKDTPRAKLSFAKTATAALRRGVVTTPDEDIDCINKALEAGWSYRDIGITKDELIAFRNGESQRNACRRYLAEIRLHYVEQKTDMPAKGWTFFVHLMHENGVSPDSIETSNEELLALDMRERDYWIRNGLKDLHAIAEGRALKEHIVKGFDPDYHCEIITRWMSQGVYDDRELSFDEFGTTQEGFEELCRKAWLWVARREVSCYQTSDEHLLLSLKRYPDHPVDKRLAPLKHACDRAGTTLHELGTSEEELTEFIRSHSPKEVSYTD